MIKLILSHDEARKIGRQMLACRSYIFDNMRFESDNGEFEDDLQLVFKEDDRGMCKECDNYIEECECDDWRNTRYHRIYSSLSKKYG